MRFNTYNHRTNREVHSLLLSHRSMSRGLICSAMIILIVISATTVPLNGASAQTVVGYNYSPWFEATGENYVEIPDATNLHLTKFSVAAWFKTSTNYWVNGMIVNKGGTSSEISGKNMNYGIWLTSWERLKAGFESADGTDYYITNDKTYSDGKWHYVVLTYDGSALRFYLDGAQLGWRPISAAPETSGTMPLRIGADSQEEVGYFKGQLDEIRVWNRAVSATEVLTQYQLGTFNTNGQVVYNDGDIPPPPPPPDTKAPSIIAPPDKLVMSTGSLTQVALGVPIVADQEDSSPTVTKNAPSGGYPVGTSAVTWTVKDDAGNTATATQKVTVRAQSNLPVTSTFCASGCNYNNLQTAINSLPAGGGKILIKNGDYVMSKTITLKSGTVLEFSSNANIYFRGDSKPVFRGSGVNNVKIIGGDIIAERTGVKAISFTSSSEITVTGTKMTLVQGGNSNGFHCVDCSGVYVSKIDARSATRPIDIIASSGTTDGKSTKIWIQDSVFDDVSIEGVKINHSKDVHIINNTISNTMDNGIDIGWNLYSEVAHNRLTRTGYPNGAAIHPDSANGADIIYNYIDTTGGTAIPVYRASNINVGENTVIDAGSQAINIITKLEPSSNVKVISNHIISPFSFGIYESPSQVQVEIANNVVEQMPAGIKAILIIWSNNGTTRVYGNVVN